MLLSRASFGLTDANRPIRLRMSTQGGVRDDQLLVKHVSGAESICGGIDYSLLCVSTQAGLELKQFIANPVELQFVTDSGGLRSVCGIVAAASEGQGDGGLASYQLIVRDAFALLDKTSGTRVFRNASEVDITATVLKEFRQANPVAARAFAYDLEHLKAYPQREFTMQYNESTGAFLRRLWKRRGISWFIQPGTASERGTDETPLHTLVLFDDAMSLKKNAGGEVRYHRDDATEVRDVITAWHALRTLTPGKVSRQSWNYAASGAMTTQESGVNDQGQLGNYFAASLDDYLVDAPHLGDNDADYRTLAWRASSAMSTKRSTSRAKAASATCASASGTPSSAILNWTAIRRSSAISSSPNCAWKPRTTCRRRSTPRRGACSR